MQEPRGEGAGQASAASRRAVIAGISAVLCVAAVALLATSSESGAARRSELTVHSLSHCNCVSLPNPFTLSLLPFSIPPSFSLS